jgi:tRNA A37 threonylcarbamoyladenosine dehydratase
MNDLPLSLPDPVREIADADVARRFAAVARLYGDAALARFARARVAVVGVGGVGSWVAEGLARSGVGMLVLIDLDHVSESNTNRQVHALDPDFGKAKVLAMADRIRAIHPLAQVRAIEEFVAPENVAALVDDVDVVLDCIDQPSAKAALIAHARRRAIQVLTCGAAGGRKDPLRIRRDDLARARGDRLLANVRQRLRRDFGFPPATSGRPAKPFGVPAIYSDEQMAPEVEACLSQGDPETPKPGSPLACGGYGSSVAVTAAMGFTAVSWALGALQTD